jgi:hypothetical protein
MNPSQAIQALCATPDWNECKIAEAVGLNQSNINRIKHGADPHYSHGLKIVQLAQTHVLKQRRKKSA